MNKILKELGLLDKPLIRVNNKCDKLDLSDLDILSCQNQDQIWISSQTFDGFESLFEAINTKLNGKLTKSWISLNPDLGWLRAKLYSSGRVREERISDQGLIELNLETYQNDLIKLLSTEGVTLINTNQTQEAI